MNGTGAMERSQALVLNTKSASAKYRMLIEAEKVSGKGAKSRAKAQRISTHGVLCALA
jgi:hypothetical protein